MLFVLVLMPKEGACARNRLGYRFDYEDEHRFNENEQERCGTASGWFATNEIEPNAGVGRFASA
jgi:hypothetical protein